ncbi:FAD binding domain-containing protein [Streptomonospora nanhaiensis]|uniref:Xanthine dehydrogenase YagS FAD-binding subunit n=1 Tax=Streptomonospora nanhaiensis TaxID=1323731 RepID=A0A853BHI1_9ACTN|nr:FAD binding domain-containing protein [Streptomonospora nanhaiensis]MBX9387874.1 FAD binding domain-containing protein [Streptomonospora nanhaiensis]NYI94062.1 xanthine dehydrogenase YagS FAD-binding subunit [Streptomonospora nanhaiensis]
MNAPQDVAAAAAALREAGAEARAGGTDLMARRRERGFAGAVTDLSGLAELRGVEWRADGSARIGALTTVAEVAGDPRLRAAYPALAQTAAALATPQIRAVGTVGGNLLQRNRCVYFRSPLFSCHQNGGDTCPARAGDHSEGTVVDLGSACVAPHPSSLAMALLAYAAEVEVEGGPQRPVADLYDGADATRDHVLAPGELLTAVGLPAPVEGEAAAYRRATSRSRAEWPLVEAVARVVRRDGAVVDAAVAVGAVARTPLRLPEVEEALIGATGPEAVPDAIAGLAERCAPLPGTGYKVALLSGTVRDVLERALAAD